MLQDILIPLVAVGLAELGDKTQLAVFCLASKTKKHLALLLGAILAFALADGLAIVLGDYLTKLFPMGHIKIASGAVFIIFGIITILNHKEDTKTCELKSPFLSSFGLVFVSELGDKTQIASGLFAAKYNPMLVFIGVMIALTLLSVMAVYLGKYIFAKLNKKYVAYGAGTLFILIGLSFFLR